VTEETYATPSNVAGAAICIHCGADVIRNYDGIGTGWSHIWPEGHPLYLHSGNKQCRITTTA
jgi:hypothetical protein